MNGNGPIRVMIVDRHEIARIGMRKLFSEHRGIEMSGFALSGEEAIKKIKKYAPDVIIMDDNINDISCKKIVECARKWNSKSNVIMYPSFIKEENIIEDLQAGVAGYVPKNIKSENLIEAIKVVYKGEHFLRGNIADIFINKYFKEKKETENQNKVRDILSKREIEVLKLICDGFSLKEIAGRLYIGIRTVETHRGAIRKKLKMRKNVEIVKYGLKNNIATV